jgi:hypothetical protein
MGVAPLALNVMVQPSGRIATFPPNSSFYLRSLPIYCAADVISLTVRIFVFCCYRLSLRKGLKDALRSSGIHQSTELHGLQKVNEMPGFRFILFSGSVAILVKLLSYEGIPWTQMVAYCYIVRYCLYELIATLETRLFGNEGFNSAPVPADNTSPGRLEKALSDMDFLLDSLAHVLQNIFMFILFQHLLQPLGKLALGSHDYRPFLNVFFVGMSIVSVMCVMAVARTVISSSSRTDEDIWEFTVSLTVLPPILFALSTYLSSEEGAEFQVLTPIYISMLMYWVLFFVQYFLAYRLAVLVPFTRSPLFLLLDKEHSWLAVQSKVLNFVTFFIYAIIGILYYVFRYDPNGTSKPAWLMNRG